ncbi:hypothetical protein HXX76_012328 [Chlamydomonas incerta]|uniref:G8 domain-containing protein n=1 Tax=Chlamydomonas incerta TaxID=51695 RepID=A0A835VW47_CHLIN|nr:hypothetical protein HXX76_012328 [Chlamydomonas incerta]|eukprot:KAG2427679.1 hypothetical protein HXX76_012328 [Chlamydomonas incerta]
MGVVPAARPTGGAACGALARAAASDRGLPAPSASMASATAAESGSSAGGSSNSLSKWRQAAGRRGHQRRQPAGVQQGLVLLLAAAALMVVLGCSAADPATPAGPDGGGREAARRHTRRHLLTAAGAGNFTAPAVAANSSGSGSAIPGATSNANSNNSSSGNPTSGAAGGSAGSSAGEALPGRAASPTAAAVPPPPVAAAALPKVGPVEEAPGGADRIPPSPPPKTPAAQPPTASGGSTNSSSNSSSSSSTPTMPGGAAEPANSTTSTNATTAAARCWVATRDFPVRVCVAWTDDCRLANASEVERCNMCSKGWGAYASQQACLDAGGGGFEPAAAGIDPATYPAPPASPYANTCGYNPGSRSRSSSSPCPHLLPDVTLWEAAASWPATGTNPGGVPAPGSAVVLPPNRRIMITGCSLRGAAGVANRFASIRIPASSELIFDDSDISLLVGALYVYGRLRAGGEGCRLAAPLGITFMPAAGVPESDLGITVLPGGGLDLHGADTSPTWTRLAASVKPGNNWVSLRDPVPAWKPGQLFFVATSIYRDEYENQNEVLSIRSASADGRTLITNEYFAYLHYGGPEYQSEVGLLSRSITLRSWPGSGATARGGHVRIMGQGRLEGVLGYRLGQLNVLGAYPFHWHNAGDASSGVSYARDCAVYASFYRCFVIHGTSGLTLSDNVAFHAAGSCYYLEDGVEENNLLRRNLGAFVHVIGNPAGGVTQSGELFVQGPNLAHPADAAAGVFYAANPNNAFKDNAASGGFAGFNFPVLPAPIGDHRWMASSLTPSRRPLKLFDGNTAHSSGYFWIMAGGIYVGGTLWVNDADGGKLYYSSGRYEMDTRDDTGTALGFHVLTNNKVWLAQWGLSHWGARVRVSGWEAHDCVRGANVFGLAQLSNAYINGRSANADAKYPAGDHDPIAGFRWYDTRVMTVLTNVTFANYPYTPPAAPGGLLGQSVWFTMVHSDEYKPAYISASRNITYRAVDGRALVSNPPQSTGASRFFNWIDHDGSATLRGRPTLVASWPTWWNLGPDCSWQPLGGVYFCDYHPWRTVGRLEVRVPGFTVPVDSGGAFPPDPAYGLGYVAAFGHRGGDARNMTITRNEGITGVSGAGGWYLHLDAGVTPALQVFLTQVPPGTSILFATRYPAGTTFSVSRQFLWYPALSGAVSPAASLQEVLDGAGDRYWFSGKHLYIKITDPGDGSVDPPFSVDGAAVWGTRYFSAWYWVNITRLAGGQDPYAACAWVSGTPPAGGFAPNPLAPGARFCPLAADPATDVPDAPPAAYNSWTDPFCTDVAPPGSQLTCAQVAAQGQCGSSAIRAPADPHAAVIGGYCAVSCGRCVQGARACVDRVPPGGMSCAQRRAVGNCGSDWMRAGSWCAASCGYCTPAQPLPPLPPAPTCTDVRVPPGTYTCKQQLDWGQCSQPWMAANGWCAATCGLCAASPAPPPPQPSPSPPPPAGCYDVTPPGGYSCAQQAGWGKCAADFIRLNNYCAATCGACTTTGGSGGGGGTSCTDVTPPGGYSCAQQAAWGKCGDGFMLPYGYCAVTCGRCSAAGAGAASCYDVQPPGGYSCAQQAGWGKCGYSDVMMPTGYCAATCGRCSSTSTSSAGSSSSPSPSSNLLGNSLLGSSSLDNWLFATAASTEADSARASVAGSSSRSPGGSTAAAVSPGTPAARQAAAAAPGFVLHPDSSAPPSPATAATASAAPPAAATTASNSTVGSVTAARTAAVAATTSPPAAQAAATPAASPAAAAPQRFGANSSYAPYQTALWVASAASLSTGTFAVDTARAWAALAAAASAPTPTTSSTVSSTNSSLVNSSAAAAGSAGSSTAPALQPQPAPQQQTPTKAASVATGGVPATKGSPAPLPFSPSPSPAAAAVAPQPFTISSNGSGGGGGAASGAFNSAAVAVSALSASSAGAATAATTAAAAAANSAAGSASSSAPPSAGGVMAAAGGGATPPALNPTFDEAFNPFENTTSIASPGSPLAAAKPAFYSAWLSSSGSNSAAGSNGGSSSTGSFSSASADDDWVGGVSGGGSSSSSTPGVGVVGSDGTFFGLPLLPWASFANNGSANSSSAGGGSK